MAEEILFIETNQAGNGVMAMRAARRLGYRCHFVTNSLEAYSGMADHPAEAADEVSIVDTYDITKLLQFGSGRKAAAVMAFDDFRAVQAAILADHLGIKSGPSYHALINVRFKDRMRERLRGTRHHVRFSKHALDSGFENDIGYPCVVKPADGSGSVGVRICDDEADFLDAVADLRSQRNKISIGAYRIDHLVIEEVVPGDEYSAEMVWDVAGSRWHLVGVTKTYLSPLPHRVELGHLFPYPLPPALEERVTHELRDVLELLGLRGTIVHLEFRLDGETIKVIEINARPAGGRIAQLTRAARGIDLTELQVMAHLGLAAERLGAGDSSDRFAGVRFFVPERPGVVERITMPPVTDPLIVDTGTVRLPVSLSTVNDNDARLAYAIATGSSVPEVETRLARYVDMIRDER
ncbi:hypothetical protein GCM10010399_03950 [Dactylosporangium fulvum]|uniref:ATP-grasp domain-containing protein n=1 Tax=Dactylosporangium fulvum TaxID=53359 RepID=A0ABY5VS81_9ACTN|nr:ATP-grasp domain-containing protein [Dactylosporangium fulvum]UWP79941.1 ATP-grasp domain-containing protein [Dactylosporangium fulvum]